MLRKILVKLINLSCLPWLLYKFKSKNTATIVLYHNPSVETFENHMRHYSNKYNIIPLNLLVNAIEARDWSNIPDYPLVITFDDGHKDNYQLLQTFRQYDIRPTIYLCSGIVGQNRKFWFNLPGNETEILKKYTNKKKVQSLKEKFSFSLTSEVSQEDRDGLSYDEISAMKECVDFQAHTEFHPILTTCDDDECKREIVNNHDQLSQILDDDVVHFAYPNGDYTQREISLLQSSGFRSGRTTDYGWNDLNTNIFMLKIRGVTDSASNSMLKAQLSGIPGYFRYLMKGDFTGRKIPIKPASK